MEALILQDPHLFQQHYPQIRHLLLQQMLEGNVASSLAHRLIPQQPIQAVICASFDPDYSLSADRILSGLTMQEFSPEECELVQMQDHFVFLLKGHHALHCFRDFADPKLQDDPNISWVPPCPENVFLAYGTIHDSPDQLHLSYRHAKKLLQQRFFCEMHQHILLPEQLLPRGDKSVLTMLYLETCTNQILQYIQTFNRTLVSQTLQEMKQTIIHGNDNNNAIYLFFADLYLQLKEQMKNLYQGYTIPFYSNTHIIRSIFQMKCLDELLVFLSQRFDMIMSSIGASSRESVLDDILHYIRHNYNTNLTLENIAPLFGYNHSYLGKIFRKRMGISFNEHIDRLRIDRAKQLLLADNTKVYVISEQVGYKNVDYFHIKFRKYENMSPAEFRKAHRNLSTSPDGEKLEKGPLFHD